MKDKITIIGSGAFATAMALVLSDANNKNIIVYGVDEKELSDLSKGQNSKYFGSDLTFFKLITTNNLQIALKDSTYILLAVPSQVIDIVFKKILNLLQDNVIIINCAKGFYPNSNWLIHTGLSKNAQNNQYIKGIVSIMGPSHAEEIVLKYPTVVNLVGTNMTINKQVQNLFKTNYFKTCIQKDIIGTEVGVAYKNIIAIASGIALGLGYGVNSQAAIVTQGLLEMSKFNKIMGGQQQTIYGLSGVGDLVATATSQLSRNFQYGKWLTKSHLHKKHHTTVEGLTALKYVYKIGQQQNLGLPIVYALYKIIFMKKNITDEITKIWDFD